MTVVDALGAEVDAGDVEAGLGERHRQRQARVAEADDPDLRLTRLDALAKLARPRGRLAHPVSVLTALRRSAPNAHDPDNGRALMPRVAGVRDARPAAAGRAAVLRGARIVATNAPRRTGARLATRGRLWPRPARRSRTTTRPDAVGRIRPRTTSERPRRRTERHAHARRQPRGRQRIAPVPQLHARGVRLGDVAGDVLEPHPQLPLPLAGNAQPAQLADRTLRDLLLATRPVDLTQPPPACARPATRAPGPA